MGAKFSHPSRQALGPTGSYKMGTGVSFPGVKRPRRGVNHPTPSSAEVKERVELYLYSPSVSSRPVLGRTSHFLYFSPIPYVSGPKLFGSSFLKRISKFGIMILPESKRCSTTLQGTDVEERIVVEKKGEKVERPSGGAGLDGRILFTWMRRGSRGRPSGS